MLLPSNKGYFFDLYSSVWLSTKQINKNCFFKILFQKILYQTHLKEVLASFVSNSTENFTNAKESACVCSQMSFRNVTYTQQMSTFHVYSHSMVVSIVATKPKPLCKRKKGSLGRDTQSQSDHYQILFIVISAFLLSSIFLANLFFR